MDKDIKYDTIYFDVVCYNSVDDLITIDERGSIEILILLRKRYLETQQMKLKGGMFIKYCPSSIMVSIVILAHILSILVEARSMEYGRQ